MLFDYFYTTLCVYVCVCVSLTRCHCNCIDNTVERSSAFKVSGLNLNGVGCDWCQTEDLVSGAGNA